MKIRRGPAAVTKVMLSRILKVRHFFLALCKAQMGMGRLKSIGCTACQSRCLPIKISYFKGQCKAWKSEDLPHIVTSPGAGYQD